MTEDAYSGKEAASELREERRKERQAKLKKSVERQESRLESVNDRLEELEEKLEEAREAKRVESKSLSQLKDTTIDDFEESVDEVELMRDDEDAVTADDVGAGSSFQVDGFDDKIALNVDG